MRFKYCPECGSGLRLRILGDEGEVPYCESCGRPYFDMFSSCVITIVVNERGEALLLRQGYISEKYCNLVSGYISPGESAEAAAEREVFEETGIRIKSLEFAGTYWFAKKDMLMIGFIARADKAEPVLSGEVDSAGWYAADKAIDMVHPEGSVSHALVRLLLKKQTEG